MYDVHHDMQIPCTSYLVIINLHLYYRGHDTVKFFQFFASIPTLPVRMLAVCPLKVRVFKLFLQYPVFIE